MSYLLDTNVVSELRHGVRADANVLAWFDRIDEARTWISALVFAELRVGVQRLARRDPVAARRLDGWFDDVRALYSERTLSVDVAIAERWARLSVPHPLPFVDGLLAATALEHDLTLVTRNTRDVARTGVKLVDPFLPA